MRMKKYYVEISFGEDFDDDSKFNPEIPQIKANSALEAASFSNHRLDNDALFKVYELRLNEFGFSEIDWNTEERFMGYVDFI